MQTVRLNVRNDVVKRRRVVPKLGTTKHVKFYNHSNSTSSRDQAGIIHSLDTPFSRHTTLHKHCFRFLLVLHSSRKVVCTDSRHDTDSLDTPFPRHTLRETWISVGTLHLSREFALVYYETMEWMRRIKKDILRIKNHKKTNIEDTEHKKIE